MIAINRNILRQCREQMALDLIEVGEKVPEIKEIEQGVKNPTFGQLDILEELYRVPRWVFVSSNLPEEYQFEKNIFKKFVK